MFLLLASVDITSISAVAIAIGAIFTGIVAVRKLGPERNQIFVSTAQGANVILEDLVATLREETNRERAKVEALERKLERLEAKNERLERENDGLRKKAGERFSDTD